MEVVIDVQVLGWLFSRTEFPHGLYSLQRPTTPLQISQHALLLMLSFFWALLGTRGHSYSLSLSNGYDYRQSTALTVRVRLSSLQGFISHCVGFV